MENHIDILKKGLKSLNLEADEHQISAFQSYLEQIKYWNSFMNLTTITADKEIVIKHFLDSLAAVYILRLSNQTVADIGTGAGLPGIPLKIMHPNIQITLIDSSKKKSEALEKICEFLKLEKYIIENANIEKLGLDSKHRGKYDIVVARALSSISVLIEMGIPLLKVGGRLILYKGPNCQVEVENSSEALKELDAKIIENTQINLPFSDFTRKIIVVEKLGITDQKYPRRVGVPKKKPL